MPEGKGTQPRLNVPSEPGGGANSPPASNLPTQLTPLVGREREAADACGILRRPDVRLLTLTGPGGVGKTRLGLKVAENLIDEFPGGVRFVSLAPIGDRALVVPTIAQTLGLNEAGERPLDERLRAHLRDRRLLLFIDNFDHVAQAAPLVTELLSDCPRLEVLVTSRASLRLSGEREYPVSPLGLPDLERLPDVETLSRYEAVALFAERARAVRPDFEITKENASAVAEICLRLDGLPLAIELAAARVRLLSPESLLARLERRLPLLKGGWLDLPARQRTLRHTFRWSHDLLDEDERRLFRRLSVFSGGTAPHAASKVAGEPEVDVLGNMEALIDKSLLRRKEEAFGEPRFAMLETVREYALERLEASGEEESVRQAHAEHYLTLAEEAEPELRGPRQVAWMERLDTEQGNLRSAMRWLLEQEKLEKAVRLGWALWVFWWIRGHFTEGRPLMDVALSKGKDMPAALRAKASFVAGTMALGQADFESAAALLEESLALFRELGDGRGTAYALGSAGIAAARQGQHERAIACFEEGRDLFLEAGARWEAAFILGFSAMVWLSRGDPERAKPLAERGLALLREGGDRQAISVTLYALAEVAQREDDHERARALLEEGLELSAEVGHETNVAHCLEGLAAVAASEGRVARATRLWGAAEALLETIEPAVYPYAPDRPLYRSQVTAARARLSQAAFEKAWAEGRAIEPEQAIELALERSPAPEPTHSPHPAGLTRREIEVLRLAAEGLTDGQVAERLHLSTRTVSNHLRSIYGKLGVPSRAAAAKEAVERGLI